MKEEKKQDYVQTFYEQWKVRTPVEENFLASRYAPQTVRDSLLSDEDKLSDEDN